MARKRTMPPAILQCSRLGSCSFAARWLFAGLWGLADREGRLEWVPKFIEGHVFPYDAVDLAALADELRLAGFLTFYKDGHRGLAQIERDWWIVNQTPYNREPESDLPPPLPGENDDPTDDPIVDERKRGDVARSPDHPGTIPRKSRLARDLDQDQDLDLISMDHDPDRSRSRSQDPALRRRAREKQRREESEALLAFWFERADRTIEPRGKARLALLAALQGHLVDHPAADIEAMIDHLSRDPWWRGRRDGGPTEDLFSKRPISWMRKTKVAEFADRVEAARSAANRPPPIDGAPELPGAAPWLATDGNADWLIRLRDRATSYGAILTADRIEAQSRADGRPANNEIASELLVWMGSR